MKLAGAYINDDTYGRLVALAAANNRTLAGQCRHLFDRALRGELPVPEGPDTLTQPQKPMAQAVGMAAAAPWQPTVQPAPVAAKQPLRPVPRALAALQAGARPGSPANPQPNAGAGAGDNPQPVVNGAVNPPAVANAVLNPQLAANAAHISASAPSAVQNPQPAAEAAPCPHMVANTTQNPQAVAGTGLHPLPVAEAAMTGAAAAMTEAAPRGAALRACENVPVAGVGVVAGMPVGIGMLTTPALSPATGQSRPVRCGVDAGPGGGCGGRNDDACFFQTNPMPMPNPNTNPNHPRPCLHTTPSPLPPGAPLDQDAHEPRNAARRMPQ